MYIIIMVNITSGGVPVTGKRSAYTRQHVAARKLKKTNKYAYLFAPLLLGLADYAAVLCAEELSFVLRNFFVPDHGELYISKFHFYIIAPVIYMVYLHLCNLYMRQMQFWRIIAGIFKANLYAILTGIFVLYAVQSAATTSRLYMTLLWLFGFFFLQALIFLKSRCC